MKVLVIEENGNLIVKQPLSGADINELQRMTPGSKIVDSSSLPPREFRDAWTATGVSLEKAKKLWASKIRKARAQKLAELDIKWMMAIERGDLKIAASIAAQKQVLRDLTEREELTKAESLEEIKSFWPSILEE